MTGRPLLGGGARALTHTPTAQGPVGRLPSGASAGLAAGSKSHNMTTRAMSDFWLEVYPGNEIGLNSDPAASGSVL